MRGTLRRVGCNDITGIWDICGSELLRELAAVTITVVATTNGEELVAWDDEELVEPKRPPPPPLGKVFDERDGESVAPAARLFVCDELSAIDV